MQARAFNVCADHTVTGHALHGGLDHLHEDGMHMRKWGEGVRSCWRCCIGLQAVPAAAQSFNKLDTNQTCLLQILHKQLNLCKYSQ